MKKILTFVLLLVLISLPIFANSQKYYAVSSEEWQMVNWLCHYAGVAGPSSNGPVSQAQLEIALQRAEAVVGTDNEVAQYLRESFEKTSLVYGDDLGSLSLSGILFPEAYFQTNQPYGANNEYKPKFALDQDWFVKSQKERSTARVILENTIGDFLYSRFALDYKQKVSIQTSSTYYNDTFHTSLYGGDLHQNVPLDAGISLGTKGFTFITGRGKVSLGEGYTGNTAIGDNYEYQEFMKFGFYTKRTAVALTLTNFDSSRNNEETSKNIEVPWGVHSPRFSGYRELRHSVTYEILPVDNLKATLSFVTLLDTNTAFDFRYLNPFMILHNYFNYHDPKAEIDSTLEGNNMITADFSWAISKKWSLYAQITMDQFQIPDEAEGYLGFGYTEPNAFGGLLNVSYSDYVKDGLLNVYLEGVYNMPGMYLNTKYYNEEGNVTQYKKDTYTHCWSQDFLMGYYRTESYYDDVTYSTYKYGPDCIVLSLGGSYRKISGYEVSFSALYMAHGEKGRGENADNYTFAGIDSLEDVNRLALTGTVEHTLALTLTGSYDLLSWLTISGGVAYSYRWNYRNASGSEFGNLQAYFGLEIVGDFE